MSLVLAFIERIVFNKEVMLEKRGLIGIKPEKGWENEKCVLN